MKNPAFFLSMIAALAAAPAFAQSEAPAEGTAAPAEAATTETPAEQTPVGGELGLGQEAPAQGTEAQAQPAQPQPYIKEQFTDWALQCIKLPDQNGVEQEVCQMFQLLKDAQGGSVAEASIFKIENGGRAVAGGTFVVPLETLLTEKLTISVDGGSALKYDFNFCTQVGCVARVGFTAEDIARFKAGAKAQITIVPMLAPDQKAVVDMSLSGFTAAFDAVQQ